MIKGKTSHELGYGPLQRKTFKAALSHELRKHIPTLGELTVQPLAKRIEEMVLEYFPATGHLRMGQILWPAVDERECAGHGKRIEQTTLKPVLLETVSQQDIEDLLAGTPRRELRKRRTVRLFEQAQTQGGVLTGIDVATILNLTPGTVSRYVREHEQQTGTLLPRRGTVHDMGRSLTHKRQICRRVIVEGRSIEDTARETKHSPEAVTRYVNDYRRVFTSLKNGLSLEQTAYTTALSKKLVSEYQDLIDEYGLLGHEKELL